ncbi:MAG: hypothetical protein GTO41_11870, partial [Burkholderiales bacterium]|nr:hypothetical protein [Burkholderiales bacterium]
MKDQAPGLLVVVAVVFFVAILSRDAASQGGNADRISADIRQELLFPSAVELDAGGGLAKSTCARCHGLNGISASEEQPHLAGQRAEYLYLELIAYKNGAREDESMGAAVKYLNDDALVQVAAYYASLEAAQVSGKIRATERDPVAEGKAAAAACAGCHGPDGNASIPGMPSLTGQQPQYLV